MGGCCTSKAAAAAGTQRKPQPPPAQHSSNSGAVAGPSSNKYTVPERNPNPNQNSRVPIDSTGPSTSTKPQPAALNQPTSIQTSVVTKPIDTKDIVLIESNPNNKPVMPASPLIEGQNKSNDVTAAAATTTTANTTGVLAGITGQQNAFVSGNNQPGSNLPQHLLKSPMDQDVSLSKKMYQASPIPAYKALQIDTDNRRGSNAAAPNGVLVGDESIDNVEMLLQSKQRTTGERQNSSNRTSIHKENYQQLTSSILARNDIFIFSNSALATSLNTSKHAKRKKETQTQLYYTLSDKESKAYLQDLKKQSKNEANLFSQMQQQQSSQQEVDGVPSSAVYSTFQDWSKILEKQLTLQLSKTLEKEPKSKANPLFDIFQSLTQLKERAWYDEITALYKERNSASKININMQETVFYKKHTMIHDHFRWLISSIANMTFNVSSVYSSFEFPPQSHNLKRRKTSSVNSASGGKPPSSEKSDGQTESQPHMQPFRQLNVPASSTNPQSQNVNANNANNNVNNNNSIPGGLISPMKKTFSIMGGGENIFCEAIPEAHSMLWVKGFIWRGVYLKVLSKKAAHTLKAEMKALKHVGLEYLQSDFSFKVNTLVPPLLQSQQLQQSQQQQMQQQQQQQQTTYINYVLPLISFVETASFVVYGTPFIYTRTNSHQESLLRQSEVKASSQFQNTYLLRNLKESNLQIIHKLDETSLQEIQTPTTSTAANRFSAQQNVCQLIVHARDLIPKHCESNVMFMVSQDANIGMQLMRVPKEGFIEITQIKKILGQNYSDFNAAALNYNQSKSKIDKSNSSSNIGYPNQQPLSRSQNSNKLDYLTFKLHGWHFKMIYVQYYDSKQTMVLNRRATELLALASKKSKDVKNVFGNALVFGKKLNQDAMVLPNILCSAESYSVVSNLNEQSKNRSLFSIEVNESREKYLSAVYKKAIESVTNLLDSTDSVLHQRSLSNIFHKNGLNLRYLMIVFSKLRSEKAKNLVGCVILARAVKRLIAESTSKIIKKIKVTATTYSAGEHDQPLPQQAHNHENDEADKNDLFNDNIFKTAFTKYMNLLLKGTAENDDSSGLQHIAQCINLLRLETISHAMEILSESELATYLNFSGTVKQIIGIAEKNANLFLQVCCMHFAVTYTPELEHNFRNDKYYFIIRGVAFKPQDIVSVSYVSVAYLTVKEIAYFFLIKLSNPSPPTHAEIELPPALYKINADSSPGGLLTNAYYMPVGETLKDLISYLNCIFGTLFSQNSEQTFFLELYVFQLFDSFFISKDDEDSLRNLMNERIQPLLQSSFLLSGELAIVIYTWFGILQETKSLLECEQSYMMALLALHKLYGDPRGRGSIVIPWELFIVSRLSMIARLQGKKHDAEYVEELYDSVVFDLQANPHNVFKLTDPIYSHPFSEFDEGVQGSSNSSNATSVPSKYLSDKPLPFQHWTDCQNLDENIPIIEALTSSLRNNKRLLQWMMDNLLIFHETGVLWETHSLRVFQLCIMQNTFQTTSSCASSISSLSDKNDQGTPKSQRFGQRGAPLFAPANQSGNIVQTLEKDFSTFSKKDAVGVMFSWGQNTQGQLGNVFENTRSSPHQKKIKIQFPKIVVSLKDTITVSVACGYQHSMAITYSGDVLAWGDNQHSQLGLGATLTAPSVAFPTRIQNLKSITQIACGSEHTIALDKNGNVFTWGNGEGGLLGHGNEESCSTPKIVNALKGLQIDCISSGGLHSLVLTKTRHVYSWGRNEGKQLGLEPKYFTKDRCYITSPQKVRGLLDGGIIVQIAAGEAHSLALAHNGQVYGWGYNQNGQIGMAQAAEPNRDYEPQIIPKLNNIDKIYSGQTFSIFMNSSKEVFCCGLNDANQLGIEKEPIKIMNQATSAIDQKRSNTDVFVPKKMDCFHQIPVLHISCGHNHSLALVVVDTKHYMLFAWGMNKHGQLGIGETGQNSSVPRPITYLQDVTTYSIACGQYHSLVIANDVNRILKREYVRSIKECFRKFDSKWNFTLMETGNLSKSKEAAAAAAAAAAAIDLVNNATDVSEEGKIEIHQPMKKMSDFNTKTRLA